MCVSVRSCACMCASVICLLLCVFACVRAYVCYVCVVVVVVMVAAVVVVVAVVARFTNRTWVQGRPSQARWRASIYRGSFCLSWRRGKQVEGELIAALSKSWSSWRIWDNGRGDGGRSIPIAMAVAVAMSAAVAIAVALRKHLHSRMPSKQRRCRRHRCPTARSRQTLHTCRVY